MNLRDQSTQTHDLTWCPAFFFANFDDRTAPSARLSVFVVSAFSFVQTSNIKSVDTETTNGADDQTCDRRASHLTCVPENLSLREEPAEMAGRREMTIFDDGAMRKKHFLSPAGSILMMEIKYHAGVCVYVCAQWSWSCWRLSRDVYLIFFPNPLPFTKIATSGIPFHVRVDAMKGRRQQQLIRGVLQQG